MAHLYDGPCAIAPFFPWHAPAGRRGQRLDGATTAMVVARFMQRAGSETREVWPGRLCGAPNWPAAFLEPKVQIPVPMKDYPAWRHDALKHVNRGARERYAADTHTRTRMSNFDVVCIQRPGRVRDMRKVGIMIATSGQEKPRRCLMLLATSSLPAGDARQDRSLLVLPLRNTEVSPWTRSHTHMHTKTARTLMIPRSALRRIRCTTHGAAHAWTFLSQE